MFFLYLSSIEPLAKFMIFYKVESRQPVFTINLFVCGAPLMINIKATSMFFQNFVVDDELTTDMEPHHRVNNYNKDNINFISCKISYFQINWQLMFKLLLKPPLWNVISFKREITVLETIGFEKIVNYSFYFYWKNWNGYIVISKTHCVFQFKIWILQLKKNISNILISYYLQTINTWHRT